MSNVKVDIDDRQLMAIFEGLDEKNQKKALIGGLRKASGILVKRTKQLIKEKINISGKTESKKGWKNPSTGVKTKALKNLSMGVHILGEFRLRFFELGTKGRHGNTKNGKKKKNLKENTSKRKRQLKGKGAYWRGSIKALHFFKKAKSDTERQIFSTLTDCVKDSIRNAILKGKNRRV